MRRALDNAIGTVVGALAVAVVWCYTEVRDRVR